LRLARTTFTELGCAAGAGNGSIDPGETIALTTGVRNYVVNAVSGAATLSGVSGTLSTSTPGVTIGAGSSSYGDIAAGATVSNATPFQLIIGPSFNPGTPIDLTLALATTGQGATQLPIRLATGTPGIPSTLISENFEGGTVPALPAGWTSAVGSTGGVNDPWVTSSSFIAGTTVAFHQDTAQLQTMRLLSPAISVPTTSVLSTVTLDFDLQYRLEDEPTQSVLAYDGLTLRVLDMTVGQTARSVLAEAFAEEITTGSLKHFPKHTPRIANASYFQDMSVWSGNSSGIAHVSMRFPAAGMTGRMIQLRFEYTQDGVGTCVDAGYPAPCGVGIDNVTLRLVPLTGGACVPAPDAASSDAAPTDAVTPEGGALDSATPDTGAQDSGPGGAGGNGGSGGAGGGAGSGGRGGTGTAGASGGGASGSGGVAGSMGGTAGSGGGTAGSGGGAAGSSGGTAGSGGGAAGSSGGAAAGRGGTGVGGATSPSGQAGGCSCSVNRSPDHSVFVLVGFAVVAIMRARPRPRARSHSGT
jgi:hypothetical protein